MGRRSNNLNQLMVNEQLLQKKLSKLSTELDHVCEDVLKAKSEINETVDNVMQLLALRRGELLKQVDNAFRAKMESVNNSMMTTAVTLGKVQTARMNNIDSADLVQATSLMEELHILDNTESQDEIKVALPVDKLRDYIMSWKIVAEADEEDNEFELDAEFVHFNNEADDSSSSVAILPSFDAASCLTGDDNMHTFAKPECYKMKDDKVQVEEWLALMKTRKVSQVSIPTSHEPYSEYLKNPMCRTSSTSKSPSFGYSSQSDSQEWLKPRRRPVNQPESSSKPSIIRGRSLEFPCLRSDSDIWVRKSARKTQVGELRYSAPKLIPAHYVYPHSYWIRPKSLKKCAS